MIFLRTLCIVWNLVRRRVTRRLTRLQTMYNVLKYSKTWWESDDISIYRYRTGTGNKFNLIMRMTVSNSMTRVPPMWYQDSWHFKQVKNNTKIFHSFQQSALFWTALRDELSVILLLIWHSYYKSANFWMEPYKATQILRKRKKKILYLHVKYDFPQKEDWRKLLSMQRVYSKLISHYSFDVTWM